MCLGRPSEYQQDEETSLKLTVSINKGNLFKDLYVFDSFLSIKLKYNGIYK